MNIYKLPQELREIEEAIDLAQGELTPEIEQRLDEFRKKEAQYFPMMASWIDEYTTAEEKLLQRSKELKEMAEQKKRSRKRLEKYVMDVMVEMGQKKLQFDTVTIRRQNNPKTVEIRDEALVPASFQTADIRIRKEEYDTIVTLYGIEPDKEEIGVRKKEILDDLKKYGEKLKESEIEQEEIERLVTERATEWGVSIEQRERLVIKGV
jgi:hypothetical protein